ncbi:MAG: 50S ribosomal protein L4 [Spiroplasma sp.]|nr:50S ribosomal protein L4 [Mycoplasmatales bacterium]
MAKINVLNIEGKKVESMELSAMFEMEPNQQAIYDAILLQRANLRQGTHKTKGRSEVRGGGRKPWRQKGTGRARQGTIRAPQWRGGGVVFGPTPRSYSLKMNKKVRKLAIKSAIVSKYLNGDMIVIDEINIKTPKTKEVALVLNTLGADRRPLFITSEVNDNLFLSSRNLPGVSTLEVDGINVLDITTAHKLLITKEAIAKIEEVLG